ncbi:hypothetical protein LIER_02787 [Lithospermum erythrorhizon]|uniref:Uncharacterized protein n=1 Tax=Lithospermum erythrorhizon TaxID=34254 RepID=A0AAV3NQQ1_LITER
MAAENEVFQGVPEVVEKCGLDMSCHQDLIESNGIKHVGVVSSPKHDSMDNSYVFVSGSNDPVDVPLDPVASSETLASENHLSLNESTIIPNGDHVESTVADGGGVVEGSDAIVENQGSPMKEEVDVVLVDASSSEIPRDMGNPGAESEEVQTESAPSVLPIEDQAPQVGSTVVLVDATSSEIPHDMGNPGAEYVEVQTESAPYVLPVQEQAPQVASTESLEQPIGALSADVLLETSIQPAQRQESKVVLLEANTGTGGSVELKGEPAFVGNSGDRTEASEGESKDLERLAPDTNNASKDNKETMELSAELSASQDCRDMELEATSQAQDVNGASDVEEASNEYKEGSTKLDTYNEPIEVHMELKEDSELDISRESITLSPDVGETGDENQDCKDKQCGNSDDLTEVLEAPVTIEADGYQLEETESEKLNLKEQNDCESVNDKRDEHECKVVVSDSPACQSAEDVEIMTLRSDVQLETEKAQLVKEGGTTQIHGVVCQLDVDSKQECDSSDIQNDLINVRMQQTTNKENVLDPALCQNEFDVCAPPLNDVVPQHDEPCEQTDGSVNILFGSLRTETEMNSKPVKSNESWEDTTTDHEVENQPSTLSEATKFADDVGVSPVDGSLRAETKNKPVKNDEGAPSDCQDVTIVHEIDHQAPRSSSAACTDSANEADMEEEALGTVNNRDEALNIEDDDSHAEDVIVASKLKASSEICSGDVHTNSDAMATVVLENSNKEGASDLFSGIAEVKSAVDGLSDAVKNQEVNLLTQYNGATGESQSNEVSASLTRSSTSATAGQEFEETRPRPFNFLVKLPRFDDEKLRDQIRSAQLEVDEKTRHRDAFRVQIQNKRPNLRSFGVAYDAAVAQEIDARRHLKATRIKIESLQSLIGRMKNALSVEDIDARIYNIEHRMQHETVSLKEEKQFIREIKQLKQHREYLSSNIGSQDEIQQALDEKDQNEDRLKALKKELVELKEKVSTAQAAAATVGKKYENENKIIQELQNQYRVANDVRQAAYENLLSLKKKLYEKNEHFRKYKSDVSAASDYALSRNEIALNRLCVGQMEMMMELWNNNEEFRKEYIRCNLRSTVRRLGTVDGRSLGPDEEPPVLPSYAIVRVDRSTSNPDNKSSSVETVLEKKIEPKIATVVEADRKPVTEITRLVKQTAKMIEPERSRLANGLASSSGADGSTSINGQNLKAIEEQDSVRKEEDSRKEVETAKLKEQDRLDEIAKAKEALDRKKLDEIAKAKEALERKKRLAEKAQVRAELRAQKEAEQREKEREKKLRKKERRKVGGAGEAPESNNHGDIEQSTEAGTETVTGPAEVARRPQKPSHFVKQSKSKPIPPPLRNRNRKKLQQWLWVIVTSLLVIALFLLGNIGIFSKVRPHRSGF